MFLVFSIATKRVVENKQLLLDLLWIIYYHGDLYALYNKYIHRELVVT